jgi:hypothetical protein
VSPPLPSEFTSVPISNPRLLTVPLLVSRPITKYFKVRLPEIVDVRRH